MVISDMTYSLHDSHLLYLPQFHHISPSSSPEGGALCDNDEKRPRANNRKMAVQIESSYINTVGTDYTVCYVQLVLLPEILQSVFFLDIDVVLIVLVFMLRVY